MDFKDIVSELAQRVPKVKETVQTEEATKTALVLPMLQALGYDVFNPCEVVPEYTCDIGTKKGEKIDYAIMAGDNPLVLIECKCWNEDLTLHDNQLLRYFSVSNVRFGVLTNGILYRFYTDLDKPNRMDAKPFLEVNLEDLNVMQVEELKKFHKSYFSVDTILATASELKYTNEFKSILAREYTEPSEKFVRFFAKEVFEGIVTSKVIETFSPLVKRSFSLFVSDLIADRLQAAMPSNSNLENEEPDSSDSESSEESGSKIETTDEELKAYYIILSILHPHIDTERVKYKDTVNYFAINIDGKPLRTFLRFRFNYLSMRRICFVTPNGKEERYDIEKLDDIYNYSERIIAEAKAELERRR